MVDRVSNRATEEAETVVQSVRLRLILVGPLRLVLAIVFLGASRVAGATSAAALLGFGIGCVLIVFLMFNDPRARFRRESEARPLPSNARVAPAWMHAAHAAFPSTLGLSVLAGVALIGHPTLAALLGGVLAGLGVAALISLYHVDPALYVDTRSGVIFRR
jgi:hypothetical protein